MAMMGAVLIYTTSESAVFVVDNDRGHERAEKDTSSVNIHVAAFQKKKRTWEGGYCHAAN